MRNISILSLSFEPESLSENDILKLIQENLIGKEDIVLLPETCLGQQQINELDDSFYSGLSKLASENNVYIQAGVNVKHNESSHTNSAVLFDRKGGLAYKYDKMYPYWGEFDIEESKILPGKQLVFADTDFGRVSAAICFDANICELWRGIGELDVELVLFSSYYSAGRQLSAHALNHHYAITTATSKPDFVLYDIDGREVAYTRGNDKCSPLVSRVSVDMDKVICHANFNYEKLLKMIREHQGIIEMEHFYDREEWCVVRSSSPEVSVRTLCLEYGVESLREYKRRSKKHMDMLR